MALIICLASSILCFSASKQVTSDIQYDKDETLTINSEDVSDEPYKPMLELGKTWKYVIHDKYDASIDGKTIAVCANQKHDENGREIFHLSISYPNDANSCVIYAYEENQVGYFFSDEYYSYMPMIDFTMEIGDSMGPVWKIVNKEYTNLDGNSRLVLTFQNAYNNNTFFWIEGIGSTISKFYTPFLSTTTPAYLELEECYTDETCLYKNEIQNIEEPVCDSYLPILEAGKTWTYKRYYASDPDMEIPNQFFTVSVGDKVTENGRDIFILNIKDSDYDSFVKTYEENGILYYYDDEEHKYLPMVDFSLEVGDELGDTDYVVTDKTKRSIEGIERTVIEIKNDYYDTAYYWIEGIGSIPNKFLSSLAIPVSLRTKMTDCYLGDVCLYNDDSLKSDTTITAYNYKPIIRYDRIWECCSGEWGPYTVKYMKFDGTEDFLGQTYHRIKTFKKSVVYATIPFENSTYDLYDDIDEHEGYLREENGKVYTLVMESDQDNYPYYSLYIPTQQYTDDSYLTEKLIYDFSIGVGDSYPAYSNIMRYGEIMDFMTRTKSSEIFDGEECMNIGMCPVEFLNFEDLSYHIVEGIGPTDHGCLNYTEFIDQPTRPWAYNYFNRVFDLDWNILYKTEDCYEDYKLPDELSSAEILTDSPVMEISNGLITFGKSNHDNAIRIYDMSGRQVKEASANGSLSVRTSDLLPGVYIAIGSADGIPSSPCKFDIR